MTEAWDLFGDVADITAWLDGSNPASQHEDAMRVMKCGEESGEAMAAYIGMVGQNPRKGVTHSMDDLLGELADVAITALCAMQHFTRTRAETRAVLAAKTQQIMARAGLRTPAAPPWPVPRYQPPDLSGTDLRWNPRTVLYHGLHEHERVYVSPTRRVLAGEWPAPRPEECTEDGIAGAWMADGTILVCPGCGLDCT